MTEANLLSGFGFCSDLDTSRLKALAQKCRVSDLLSVHLKIRTEKLIETWVEAFGVGRI